MVWAFLPLKFLITSFLAAPGLLLVNVADPADLVSPLAWPEKKALLALEHDAVGDSSAIFTSSPVHSERSSNRNFFWMCCEEEEQDAEELHAALGDLGDAETESVSSLSELRIFLFLQGVRLLSLFTSEAAALASWLGAGGLGEGKPVGNMKKRNTKKSSRWSAKCYAPWCAGGVGSIILWPLVGGKKIRNPASSLCLVLNRQ